MESLAKKLLQKIPPHVGLGSVVSTFLSWSATFVPTLCHNLRRTDTLVHLQTSVADELLKRAMFCKKKRNTLSTGLEIFQLQCAPIIPIRRIFCHFLSFLSRSFLHFPRRLLYKAVVTFIISSAFLKASLQFPTSGIITFLIIWLLVLVNLNNNTSTFIRLHFNHCCTLLYRRTGIWWCVIVHHSKTLLGMLVVVRKTDVGSERRLKWLLGA